MNLIQKAVIAVDYSGQVVEIDRIRLLRTHGIRNVSGLP